LCYAESIVEILNAQGEQGWILVQVTVREQNTFCLTEDYPTN